MKKRAISNMVLLVLALCLVSVSYLPSAHAFDSTKVVLLPVFDKAGYKSPDLNDALMAKLRSQFRFPKYDVIMSPAVPLVSADRPTLEKIMAENSADGIVSLEITRMRSVIMTTFRETLEQTDLTLTLTYFDKQSGQYGQIKADRSVTDVAARNGSILVSADAMDEILNKLDKIFPMQFPGPRY